MELIVYLAGHIHGPWREEFRRLAARRNLPIRFVGPQEDHDLSDAIGEKILGPKPDSALRDLASAQVNNLRTRVLLQKADVVVALFGERFRQWNTAMDAATAIAMGKPVVLVRDPSLGHALKELSDRAQLVADTPEQAIEALAYIFQ